MRKAIVYEVTLEPLTVEDADNGLTRFMVISGVAASPGNAKSAGSKLLLLPFAQQCTIEEIVYDDNNHEEKRVTLERLTPPQTQPNGYEWFPTKEEVEGYRATLTRDYGAIAIA